MPMLKLKRAQRAGLLTMFAIVLAALICQQACGEALLEQESFRNTQPELEQYPELAALLQHAVQTPGLGANFVPQGFTWIPEKPPLALLSGYVGAKLTRTGLLQTPQWESQSKRSVVFLLDMKTGQPLRLAWLVDDAGKALAIHAGGVAVSGRYFWIPSSFCIRRFPLDALLESADQVVRIAPIEDAGFRVDALGSYIAYHDGYLWIGDFARGGAKQHVRHHAKKAGTTTYRGWTAAYALGDDESLGASASTYDVDYAGKRYTAVRQPDLVLHHRQHVQGILFLGNGRLGLSISYGNNDSKIAFYDLGGDPWQSSVVEYSDLPGGGQVRSRIIGNDVSGCKWLLTLQGPPGSEGMGYDGTHWAVVFEGGAKPYRDRWKTREDRILRVALPEILQPAQR